MIIALPPADALARAFAPEVIIPSIQHFQNGEVCVHVPSLRGSVSILATCVAPVAASIMDVCAVLDAAKRAGATEITLDLLYMAHGRDADGAVLTCRLFKVAGADHIRVVDPHMEAELPLAPLMTTTLFADDIQRRFEGQAYVIVSPDGGGAKRAQRVAQRLESDALVLTKKRLDNGDLAVTIAPDMAIHVAGKTCILVDDLIDSGRTLRAAADVLMQHGALAVHAYVTHGVLGSGAAGRIQKSALQTLTLTDSLPWILEVPHIRVLSLASLFSKPT